MKLIHANNLDALKTLEPNSIDSVVTDPPYGLSFMNKKWDHDVPSVEFWKEVLRVLKPGGHVLSFGGTRTYHRMAVNIEDAGFEIRDQIMWLYGSGFPKSHNISKGIDKKLGCERENLGPCPIKSARRPEKNQKQWNQYSSTKYDNNITKPSSDQAKHWDGFGTALKPANEPIVLARKPLSEKTIVDNVLKWGTGAINIDGCKISFSENEADKRIGTDALWNGKRNASKHTVSLPAVGNMKMYKEGRWPANVILDEIAGEMLDEQVSKTMKMHKAGNKKNSNITEGKSIFGIGGLGERNPDKYGNEMFNGASRFFYCAKASKKERNAGLEGMPLVESGIKNDSGRGFSESDPHKKILNQNHHPTVKPIKLMEYLIKLITPPNGVVLDPFMGSGSTGVAAKNLGFDFVGMELDQDYFEIAKKRIGI